MPREAPATPASGLLAIASLRARHHLAVPLDAEADREPRRADEGRLRAGQDLEPDDLVPPVVVVHEVGGIAVYRHRQRVAADAEVELDVEFHRHVVAGLVRALDRGDAEAVRPEDVVADPVAD